MEKKVFYALFIVLTVIIIAFLSNYLDEKINIPLIYDLSEMQ